MSLFLVELYYKYFEVSHQTFLRYRKKRANYYITWLYRITWAHNFELQVELLMRWNEVLEIWNHHSNFKKLYGWKLSICIFIYMATRTSTEIRVMIVSYRFWMLRQTNASWTATTKHNKWAEYFLFSWMARNKVEWLQIKHYWWLTLNSITNKWRNHTLFCFSQFSPWNSKDTKYEQYI